jgi:Ni/Fe-hydrogenase subunit HybB-like protein
MIDHLRRTPPTAWALLAALTGLVGFGVWAFAVQLTGGLGVTGLNDQVVWGIYVAGFVFFLGVACAAALVSAVLRLTGAPWRAAVTRIADLVTVAALSVALLLPLADLGRPDRMVNILRYGRWESPALWDVFALGTFLAAALFALYVGLIPDLAACRDRLGVTAAPAKRWLYRVGAAGWAGQPSQQRHHRGAQRALALLLVPVALTVPTIVSWVAALTRSGAASAPLHSASLVAGTLLGGVAVLIVVMAAVHHRKTLPTEISQRAFVSLGYVLAGLAGTAVALQGLQRITTAHGTGLAGAPEQLLLATTPLRWLPTAALLLPLAVMLAPRLRRVGWITGTAVVTVAGMALEHYATVVGGLVLPRTPAGSLGSYAPTWVELGVMAGAVGLFALLLATARTLVPVVAVSEVAEQEGGQPPAWRLPGSRRAERRLDAVSAAVVRSVLILAVTVVGALAVWPQGASAHPQREVEEPAPLPPVEPAEDATTTSLRLYPPLDGVLGADNVLEAVLLAPDGSPVVDAPVTFTTTASWGTYVHGEVGIGAARTDERGFARITFEPRVSGHIGLGASFAGDADHQPATAFAPLSVYGIDQLYAAPGGPANRGAWWLAAALAAAWLVLLLAAGRVVGIAHTAGTSTGRCPFGGASRPPEPEGGRRRFLTRYLVPAGMGAVAATGGVGLLSLLGRSARAATRPPEQQPPVAAAGGWSRKLRPLPELLEREVSFADEVLPILLRRGGPHVHAPKHSPIPFHVHLDSYEGVMEGHTTPGHEMAHALVEPGDPAASRLVTVLRDPSMQMPPGVPLPDEEIQLIASWVAQGAEDN